MIFAVALMILIVGSISRSSYGAPLAIEGPRRNTTTPQDVDSVEESEASPSQTTKRLLDHQHHQKNHNDDGIDAKNRKQRLFGFGGDGGGTSLLGLGGTVIGSGFNVARSTIGFFFSTVGKMMSTTFSIIG